MDLTEADLYQKLAATFHLNVPERHGLPGGTAKASLLLDAIERSLRTHGWYPAGGRPEDDFAGGLIELLADGSCRIHWKSEFSFLRYELDAVGTFATPSEAAKVWLRVTFRDNIDGIPIDWQA